MADLHNQTLVSALTDTQRLAAGVPGQSGAVNIRWVDLIAQILANVPSSSEGGIRQPPYATIAARNTDQANVSVGTIVEVTDASADTTVVSGIAWYVRTSTGWQKIAAVEGFRENLGALALLDTVDLGQLTTNVRVELSPDVINLTAITISTAGENADVNFGASVSAGNANATITLLENAGQFRVSALYNYRHYYVEVIQSGVTAGLTFTGWAAAPSTSFTFSGDIGTDLLNTAIGSITKFRLWGDNQNVIHVERLDENEFDNGINGLTIQTGTVSIPFLNSTKFRRYSLSLGEDVTVSFVDAAFRTGYSIVVTVTGASRAITWPSSVAAVTSAVAAITGASWVAGTNILTLPVGTFELGIDFDGTNDLLKVVGPYE